MRDAQPSVTPSPSASAAAEPSKPEGYQSAPAPRETTSGELLLVEAYAIIWILVLGFVVLAWRRTRDLESRLAEVKAALDRAKNVPSTKRSAKDE